MVKRLNTSRHLISIGYLNGGTCCLSDCYFVENMVAPASSPLPNEETNRRQEDEAPSSVSEPFDRDMTKTPPITAGKNKRSAKRGKIGKKPADMPRRPLSGYNYFFSEQRSKILEEQSKVKDEKRDIFTTLGRIVADRWKKLGEKEKEKYNELAAKDLIRYRKEMEKYNEKVAMRSRKEAERKDTAEDRKGQTKPAALPAESGSADNLDTSMSSSGNIQRPLGVPAFPQVAQGLPLDRAFAGFPGTIPQQSIAGNFGLGPSTAGTLPRMLQLQQQLELERLALAQHRNLTQRMDPLFFRPDMQYLLGQLPVEAERNPRISALYPSAGAGINQEALLQLPATSSQTPSSASALVAPRMSDAAILQTIGGRNPQSHAAIGFPEGLSFLEQMQRHQNQQTEEESIRQVYARMIQRQQAEEEEALRQFRLRGWPPRGPL